MLKLQNERLNDKIISIKFVSGEEIIAQCVQHEESSISLKRPLSLVMATNKDASKAQVNFAPWMLSITHDQLIKLDFSKIMFVAEAGKDAARQYMDAVK
jgi:hypothetical protein